MKLKSAAEELELWNLFNVYVLEQNHRQGEDKHWADVLNEIRKADGTLKPETVSLLESRLIDAEDKDDLDACHIMFKNEDCNQHNLKMLNKLPGELVELPAQHKNPRGWKPPLTDYGTIKNTKFMKMLQLKKGARVKLIFNVSTLDNLTNGVMGTVIAFCRNSSGNVECVTFWAMA